MTIKKKISSPELIGQFQPHLAQRRFQVYSNKEPVPFPREMIMKLRKYIDIILKSSSPE